MATELDESLGALQGDLGGAAVVLDGLVEGRCEGLALDRSLEVGDLLRALAGQHDHQMNVVVVGGDPGGDVLEQEGLARLGRGDDQGSLAPAQGRHQVDDPLRQVARVRLQ